MEESDEEGLINPLEEKRKQESTSSGQVSGHLQTELHNVDEHEDESDLPPDWCMYKHVNTLPFWYHKPSGAISWTKPYVRKINLTSHNPPLSAFQVIVEYHEKEYQQALEKLGEAKQKREEKSKPKTTKKTNDNEESANRSLQTSMELEKPPSSSQESNKQENSVLPPQQPATDDQTASVKEIELPPQVKAIQSHLIMLVAAMVQLEKLRKVCSQRASPHNQRKSYEDFVETAPEQKERFLKRKRVEKQPNELNPTGKTAISFLQEWCFNVLKVKPEYKVTIQEDPSKPFVTTVIINGQEYGKAAFVNKKHSKQLAAELTLEMLAPGLFPRSKLGEQEEKPKVNANYLSIDDPLLITMLDTMLKTPTQVIQEYCCRYHKVADFDVELVDGEEEEEEKKFKITGTIQRHTAVAFGKNKRDAKQRAAQLLLKQVHPECKNWGELLELYARKEDDKRPKGPNFQLLEKLKEEMRKAFPSQPPSSTPATSPPPPVTPSAPRTTGSSTTPIERPVNNNTTPTSTPIQTHLASPDDYYAWPQRDSLKRMKLDE